MYYRFKTIKYHKILGYRILPFIMTSLKMVPMNPLMFFMMLTSKTENYMFPKVGKRLTEHLICGSISISWKWESVK